MKEISKQFISLIYNTKKILVYIPQYVKGYTRCASKSKNSSYFIIFKVAKDYCQCVIWVTMGKD